jgi:hypothetical protein
LLSASLIYKSTSAQKEKRGSRPPTARYLLLLNITVPQTGDVKCQRRK